MITTKTRSIKTSKALMDHFERFAESKGETLNSLIVKMMRSKSKFKESSIKV